MMYLGVDGGGTKTAYVLLDDDGTVRARHEGGGSYYLELGMPATAALLREGVAATLAAAGATPNDVGLAFFGLPAYGEDSSLQADLDALPAGVLPRYACGNDMVCGWAGSLAGGDGISIVAGTGSIAYGEYQGRAARAGGWGELFSDEGSAYWIAREGLTLFSRMSDGRAEPGPLLDLFRGELKLAQDLDLCGEIYTRRGGERSQVAQLARLVWQAASGGDTQAMAIFERAAAELADIVHAVGRQLAAPAGMALPVSYSGGVVGDDSLVLAPFTRELAARGAYTLVQPRFAPAIGAALHAARLAGTPLNEAALARLQSHGDTP
ncbi:N-acetylglucosamine kinase-like BadF-type ATPase [Pseudoduganella lurida]|uniref:N-acetylglucosamine kinase-like BadF-type ATPase n=1 Tax=Pseudoduganella lurida TaxID=1036180 RepID=A0A562RDY4_9BURK|nr:BadF/BadG/BcrA/BcrD ATPase family protein [Pseudoduganella lurida]TWI67275.1 N-acetylglucosamine kinase-like BadF-type ATPase [Pseudoduganella lurida]